MNRRSFFRFVGAAPVGLPALAGPALAVTGERGPEVWTPVRHGYPPAAFEVSKQLEADLSAELARRDARLAASINRLRAERRI
jgi:hypothetical protein